MELLPRILEAILFVAGGPVAIEDVARALSVTELEARAAADALERACDEQARGLCLRRFGSHVQMCTRPELAEYIERLLQPVQKQSLSQSALETLSIVAYRQPVTRLEVEAVRGVQCDYSLQSLMNKGLICEVGRKEALGRPILYGTTDEFLSHFGLSSLADLPKQPGSGDDDAPEALVP